MRIAPFSLLARFPLLKGILPVDGRSALRDAVAGVSLASMDIPQVLGYARIAAMPAAAGLYTVFLPLIAFALFGASRHLVVAADSATATIFASRLSEMATPTSAAYVELASCVALLTAALLLIARIFKLGFLADFLSRTVLTGFLAGVGVQLAISMLPDLLGVSILSTRSIDRLVDVVVALPATRPLTLGIAASVVLAILLGKRFAPHAPVPLVAVVLSIAAARYFDFSAHGVSLLGPVAGGLPALHLPHASWQQWLDLLPVAASCVVMIIAQSAAASRVFAQRYREPVDGDADLLGLAAANLGAALSGTFVVNGSPTQTAMADRAGSRSQIGQLSFALVAVIVLVALSGYLQYLPHCVLAAIVFTIAIGLIDWRTLIAMRGESPGECTLALVTAAAVVLVGVEHGILLAVALSLLRHVRHSYRPHTLMLAPGPLARWVPVAAKPGLETAPGLIVYRFGADLFYANDHFFVDDIVRLVDAAPHPVKTLIVDAAAITDLDYSASRSVADLCKTLEARGVRVLFARVNAYLRADMQRHGIVACVGEARIFGTLHEALEHIGVNALERVQGE